MYRKSNLFGFLSNSNYNFQAENCHKNYGSKKLHLKSFLGCGQLSHQVVVRNKEVCNRGVACSLLKLGSLVCTQAPFFVEKTMSYVILGNDKKRQKKTNKYYGAKLIL